MSNAILHLAHLYNAAKQSDLWPPELVWKDMEYFITRQGEAYVFVGGRPTTCNAIRNVHDLARGVSLAATANHRRHNAPRAAGRKRDLKPISSYVALANASGLAHGVVSARFEQIVKAYLDRIHPDQKQRKFTPVQMLQHYTDALLQDEMHIRVSVLSFEFACITLLRQIRDDCIAAAPVVFDKKFNSDDKLGNFVSAVFAAPDNKNLKGAMFVRACGILRKHIEEQGDAELKKARGRVHLPIPGFFGVTEPN